MSFGTRTSCGSGAMGVMWFDRGAIGESVTDEEGVGKCLHVPATSSEGA